MRQPYVRHDARRGVRAARIPIPDARSNTGNADPHGTVLRAGAGAPAPLNAHLPGGMVNGTSEDTLEPLIREIGGRLYATLNLNAFDEPQPGLAAEPFSYEGESAEAKAERRRAAWTPLRLA